MVSKDLPTDLLETPAFFVRLQTELKGALYAAQL
jgi:hypothetical protein